MAMEKFHFDSPKGKITVPKFKHMPFGIVRKSRHIESDQDKVFYMLEQMLDEKNLSILDELTGPEVNDFMTAWQADSDISVGESSAS